MHLWRGYANADSRSRFLKRLETLCRVGVVGLDAQGFGELSGGFVVSSEAGQRKPEAVMRIGIIGFHTHDFGKLGRGFFALALPQQGIGKVETGFQRIGFKDQCLPEVLAYDRVGNSYLYRPAFTRAEMARAAMGSFVQRVFDGGLSLFLAQFVEQASEEELAALKEELARAESRKREKRGGRT